MSAVAFCNCSAQLLALDEKSHLVDLEKLSVRCTFEQPSEALNIFDIAKERPNTDTTSAGVY